MARLNADQWQKARAEYEVRGISLGDIAKNFGINISSVSRKAKTDNWQQGKMQEIVNKKVASIKALQEVETQTQDLPLHFKHTIETVAKERLQAEGVLAELDILLAQKACEFVKRATSPDDLETISRTRRNIAPVPVKDNSTTVNVTQQQAAIQPVSPRDALAEITAQAKELPDDFAQ